MKRKTWILGGIGGFFLFLLIRDAFRLRCLERNRAGVGRIFKNLICRAAESGGKNERLPGGLCVCSGEKGIYPGICGLRAGAVSYGIIKENRRVKVAGKDGIKRRYGRNALSEWFEADIGQENNCRAAIVCDGRPFCDKGELRPGLTAGADRAAFDRVLEEFCRRVPGTVTVSYEQTDRQYAESEAQIRLLAWGLILFIGLIGILNIINTVYTNIHTRITENGIQRAMGMSAGSLYRVFLWEGFYYGIRAAVIGCITGYIGTVFVEAGAADVLRLTAVPVVPMACASLFSIGACILATCIPLRKISRMSIVDSIELVE